MAEIIEGITNGDPISIALLIVGSLIILLTIVSGVVSIVLAIKYVKFNRRKNSCGLTGEQIARKILDDNGLEKIRVKCVGSIMFGNSYSHYFKKVRLRRRTWKKDSVSSLAMAAQKSCLAILDKEKDKDMKTRIVLTPLTIFGPFMFIPLLIVGVILDIVIAGFTGWITILFAGLGLGFFLLSFVLSLVVLKTEVKAQKRAYEILKENNMVTEDELLMLKELFRLYNIEYVNDVILEFLEIIYRILQIVSKVSASSSSSSSSH